MVSEVRYVSFLTVKISRVVAFNAARTFKTPLIYAYINPLIAVALGSLLLGEPLSARIVFAAGLVLAGIAVVRGVQSSGATPAAPRRAQR